MHSRLISTALGATLVLSGCNLSKNSEDAVNAKVALERAKDFQAQIVELKAENEKLTGKVAALESEIVQLKDRLAKQARTASAAPVPATKKTDGGSKSSDSGKAKSPEQMSPAELEALRNKTRGGGGFK